MSKGLVFFIVMLITLMLGGIASGIYVAVVRNRTPEEQKKNPVNIVPVVSMIMVTSLFLGLVIFGAYYILSMPDVKPQECPTCAKCLLSEDDFVALKHAEAQIQDFQNKASYVPDVSVQQSCTHKPGGIKGQGSCGSYFAPGGPAPPVSTTLPKVRIADTPVAPKQRVGALPAERRAEHAYQPFGPQPRPKVNSPLPRWGENPKAIEMDIFNN